MNPKLLLFVLSQVVPTILQTDFYLNLTQPLWVINNCIIDEWTQLYIVEVTSEVTL